MPTTKTLSVEVTSRDRDIAMDVMETTSLSTGQAKELPGNASLKYQSEIIRKVLDVPTVVNFALSLGSQVAVDLVASWLYEKLKGKDAVLKIDRTEVRIEKGEIARIIKEKIEKK